MDKLHSKNKIILLISLIVFLFWGSTIFINVYRFPIIGVIYEILWLPMFLLLFGLPILSIIMIIISKESLRKPWFFCLGIQILTLTTQIYFK